MPILVQSEKFLRFKFKISITLISLPTCQGLKKVNTTTRKELDSKYFQAIK